MFDLDKLIKSKAGFTLLLLIGAFSYWVLYMWWNDIIKKYDPLVIAAIFYFLLLFPIIIGLINKYTILTFKKSLNKIPRSEYFNILLIITFMMLYAYLIFVKVFKYHSVATIRLTEFIATVFVNIGALYIFYKNTITTKSLIGMIMTAVGGYLVIDNTNT